MAVVESIDAGMIRVGVVGPKALTAGVLIELLLAHPRISLTYLGGREDEDAPLSSYFSNLRGRLEATPCDGQIRGFDARTAAAECDAVFLCLPHGDAAKTALALIDKGVRVFDLSADFRLNDPKTYAKYYGDNHPDPKQMANVPYALAEWEGRGLRDKLLVAIPGCYTTTSLLPLLPLVKEGLLNLDNGPIIIDAKSGVSGAGRKSTEATHFISANEAFAPYGVGVHRHRPEITEKLSLAAGKQVDAVFTPHLVPMDRGIVATIYVQGANADFSAAKCRACWQDYYGSWPLIRIIGEGDKPTTKAVTGTGFADLAAYDDRETDTVILVGITDNLMKGASSQALQAFNLNYGLPDAMGILPEI